MSERSVWTPGPWWAGTDEDAHMIYAGDEEAVADTLRDDGDSITEAANAKLIAAAPDLVSALQAYMHWEAEIIMNNKSWPYTADGLPRLTQEQVDRWVEVQQQRNAALAKAGVQ